MECEEAIQRRREMGCSGPRPAGSVCFFFADTLQREAENMIASGKTQDHLNAARAFVEKATPVFEGR